MEWSLASEMLPFKATGYNALKIVSKYTQKLLLYVTLIALIQFTQQSIVTHQNLNKLERKCF